MSMSLVVIVFTFVSMGAFAFLMWHVVQKQERHDPEFEQKLAADDRRAEANRKAAIRGVNQSPSETPGNKSPNE